jgi:hypothetical protein
VVRRTILTIAAGLALCACAAPNLDVIQVGPWFAARDPREVEVFTSREQTRKPWGGIGIIHGPRVSAASGKAKMEKMKAEARKAAAGMGADGVIIAVDTASSDLQMGEYQEPEIYLSALAIKYVTAVSTPSAK